MLILTMLLSGLLCCKRQLSKEETVRELKTAMQKYLMTTSKFDSTKIKFDIEDINYFEDAQKYNCEFKVRMRLNNSIDTTGMMAATISKDFTTVKRRF